MNLNAILITSYGVAETIVLGSATGLGNFVTTSNFTYASGTGSGSADLHYEHTETLAAGSSSVYNLAALTDDTGRSVPFRSLRALAVVVTSRSSGDYLSVGAATSTPFVAAWGTGSAKVYDQIAFAVASSDAYAVTTGAGNFKVTNSGASAITYTVNALGLSV